MRERYFLTTDNRIISTRDIILANRIIYDIDILDDRTLDIAVEVSDGIEKEIENPIPYILLVMGKELTATEMYSRDNGCTFDEAYAEMMIKLKES
jgi:hypothetical protein